MNVVKINKNHYSGKKQRRIQMKIMPSIFKAILLITSLLNFAYATDKTPSNLPLFNAFPELAQKLPHLELGEFPTPIQKLEQLGSTIKFKNIYIKRDDLDGMKNVDPDTNTSNNLFGGNKVRKLEFLLANALAEEAETVLTFGAAGSNHALETAIYSQLVGLDCIIMLVPQENASYVQRNLLLDLYYDPTIKAYLSPAQRDVDMMNTSQKFILDNKKSPYFIPAGGSNEIGSIGYVNAAFELKEQIDQKLLPEPDLIYVTAGSCGTSAGLILGIKAAGLKSKVIAVRICGSHENTKNQIETLISLTNKYLNQLDPNFKMLDIKYGVDFEINSDFVGEKYAKISVEAAAAIKLLNMTEKIKLDGTYTGKTFAALLNDVKNKKELADKNILFIDTFCSGTFEELTKQVDYKDLPNLLQRYFELPLQPLDQGC